MTSSHSLRVALQIKGVLWITHRISGLEDMDQILVLDHGILVQQGKWADLVSSGWDVQADAIHSELASSIDANSELSVRRQAIS